MAWSYQEIFVLFFSHTGHWQGRVGHGSGVPRTRAPFHAPLSWAVACDPQACQYSFISNIKAFSETILHRLLLNSCGQNWVPEPLHAAKWDGKHLLPNFQSKDCKRSWQRLWRAKQQCLLYASMQFQNHLYWNFKYIYFKNSNLPFSLTISWTVHNKPVM